jgi:hypothetical protein
MAPFRGLFHHTTPSGRGCLFHAAAAAQKAADFIAHQAPAGSTAATANDVQAPAKKAKRSKRIMADAAV